MWIRKQALPGVGSTPLLSSAALRLQERNLTSLSLSLSTHIWTCRLPLLVTDGKNKVVHVEGLTQFGERANEPRKHVQLSHPRFVNDD